MSIVETSIAFEALNGPSRRTYGVIAAAIERNGGKETAITTAKMLEAMNISSTSSIAASIRALKALGFVTVTTGHRGTGVYSLATDWMEINDPARAKHLAIVAKERTARKPQARTGIRGSRKPVTTPAEQVEVETEPEQRGPRPITLPVLAWPTNPNAGL